jgi:hypothetical protein
MRIIYCCLIQLGGEISNYTGSLPPYSFPLPIPSSLPFSLSVLGGCQILTLEAPLITEKASCMYNGYIYSKDDVRSPFVKPPWIYSTVFSILAQQLPVLHFSLFANSKVAMLALDPFVQILNILSLLSMQNWIFWAYFSRGIPVKDVD